MAHDEDSDIDPFDGESADGELTPDQALHWLDRWAVPYRIEDGLFLYTPMEVISPGVLAAINGQHDDLVKWVEWAQIMADHHPVVCGECAIALRPGQERISVWIQAQGKHVTLHSSCWGGWSEARNLSDVETLHSTSGFKTLIIDSGMCAQCQQKNAVLPNDAPNLCIGCWRLNKRIYQFETGIL